MNSQIQTEEKTIESKIIENNDLQGNEVKEVEKKEPTYIKEERKANKKVKIIILFSFIFVLAILSTIFAIININNTKILSGIKINNFNVKGLSKEEAILLLQNKTNEAEEIILNIDGVDFVINKANLNVEYNFSKAVEQAYAQGRDNNIFINNFNILKNSITGKNIEVEIKITDDSLQNEVDRINSLLPNGLQESSYSIEEDNLIIKRGQRGKGVKAEEVKEKLMKYITNNQKQKIILSTVLQEPKAINIENIREQIYVEPKDAYYEQNPFKVFSHVNGVDFDLEEAKKILEEEKEEYIIPLIITKPQITTDQIGTEAFPTLLGRCTTKYDESNAPRSTNLKVASKALNGMIINSGETFSYNRALGERTYAKGYRVAEGFAGGKKVPMTGGGICQISSTLYNAVIYANLGIIERHNHAHIAAYLDPGKDATVVYGSLDFKFKNTRKNPIMVKASAKNGIATVEIYGKKEQNEYEIEIISKVSNYIEFRTIYEEDPTKEIGYEKIRQQGMRGCNSVVYKIYKLNGVEVSREVLSKDSFAPMHKYITIGTKAESGENPIAPEIPTAPTNPEEPEEPVQPGEPEEPGTPAQPGEPEEPGTPEQPGEPEEPGVPEQPGEPEEPGTPEQPGEPEEPIDPAA